MSKEKTMKQDIEAMIVEFNNGAASIYSNMLRQFLNSVHNISRSKDENVFKMQAAKYAYALKLQLSELVKKTSEGSESDLNEKVQPLLSARVNYYMQQFKLKWNAL
jgi:hypothetical protein